MANNLQNRQLTTEFSVQMARFYNDLDVTTEADCTSKTDQLSKCDEEISKLILKL